MGKLLYIGVFVLGAYYYNHPEKFTKLESAASIIAQDVVASTQEKSTEALSDYYNELNP